MEFAQESTAQGRQRLDRPVTSSRRASGHAAARQGHRRARAFAGVLAFVTAAAATSESDAELVAAWSFNDVKPVRSIAADLGVGVLDLYAVGGEADLFSGTTLNALEGWAAGDALGLRGSIAEGGLLVASSIGRTLGTDSVKVTVSFAARRSSTGFTQFQIESWTGTSWDLLETVDVGTDWSASSVSFERSTWWSDLELRLTPLEAIAGTGTFRLDNLRIDVTPVPAPGAIGLAAIAVGGGRRGRRRPGTVPAGTTTRKKGLRRVA